MNLQIPENVIFEELEGEAVLLDLNNGEYFSLNASGTMAWKQIQKYGDLDKVRSAMQKRFDVPVDALERDLISLINALITKGLLDADT